MGQYIFWSCAVGTLGIILYRKQKRKKQESDDNQTWKDCNRSTAQSKLHRQIYKGLNKEFIVTLTEEENNWWKGLGEELQEDIETFVDETS